MHGFGGTPSLPPLHAGGMASMQGPRLNDRLDQLEAELMHMKSGSQSMAMMPQSHFMPPQYMMPPQQPMLQGGMDSTSLMQAHQELVGLCANQHAAHQDLMKAHTKLIQNHEQALKAIEGLGKKLDALAVPGGKLQPAKKKHPCLGVVRLDYNYPPAAGDIDCPGSYGYDVFFRVIPGLTFEVAQAGHFPESVERAFAEGIKYLEMKGVHAITGDCGFMMAFQVLARKIASKPVFMSSMCQCPVIAAAFEPQDQILILTANGASLRPQKEILLSSCGFDVNEDRFVIMGCQDVPGFDAVAKGEAVPLDVVQPGIVKLTLEVMKKHPRISAILLECTELPPYADALRAKTGLPVWDAITGADFYINAFKDNPRFGINDWLSEWDGHQDEYEWGQGLTEDAKANIQNKQALGKDVTKLNTKKKKPTKQALKKTAKKAAKQQHPTLGVIRLDYNYPPAAGDIDHPGSYDYDIIYRCVPGLTFDMAQAGKMTFTVEGEFRAAVKWLEDKGASGITGDCGFMMAFQPIAREVANIPVFMSSMVQCPMISVAFDKYDKILILTANSMTLKPQKANLLSHCGFDVDDVRFVIRGCQDVPGFDAVEKGEAVDVDFVTPGIVKMTKEILFKNPTIRAILLECTELPPYADALRKETDLPVFDAITCADFFISAFQDNPRFGLNQWQADWDGTADEYTLGQNLSDKQKARTLNVGR